MPAGKDADLLAAVYRYFAADPYAFEQFAAELWRASQPNVDKIDVTRPWRDGGRDAVGDLPARTRDRPGRRRIRP
jgi:hypothetical protein